MSLVAVCHRFHNCMCPSNSIPLYIIRHCGRLAPSYKSRFNVLSSALLNWMAFALGQRHIAFSRDPVIRRILFTPGVSNEGGGGGGEIFSPQGSEVKHFTPKEARRFYLSSGVFPSRMLWIHGLSYSLAEPLGHINTLAQMLHFANWSFHFIRNTAIQQIFFNSNKLHFVTTGTLWNKTFVTINYSTQMIFYWPSLIKKRKENWPRNKEKLTK